MRRLSIAAIAAASTVAFIQIASAADLPVKAPAAPVAVPYNWTGFYVGGNIGGGWRSRDVDYSPNDPYTTVAFPAGLAPPAVSFDTSGVIGGLQLGYNWQFNHNWLLGVETDFDWSGIKGARSDVFATFGLPLTATEDERVKWFGTVRARLGYLPTDNFLAFITGGFAYGRVEHSGSLANPPGNVSFLAVSGAVTCISGTTCFAGSLNSTATGWTAGGGFEYGFWKNLTLRAEYLYVSLDSKSVTETAILFTPGVTPASFNANFSRTTFNVARVGVNYRF
jgi:outer membrane immunogenic protein